MARRRRSRRGAGLFAVYAAASLVPVCVLGAVLMHGYHLEGQRRALDQGRAQAAVIEQMAIAPAISGADLTRGLRPGQRDRLRTATDLAVFHGSVLRLRLLTFEGGVSFSDDGRMAAVDPTRDAAFRAAADGQVDVRLVSSRAASSGTAMRVVQPVVAESNGRAVGILDVYLPYDAIAEKVQAETRATVLHLAVGLLGLYAVLALISWWTTRALRRHAADHEHQALHDSLTGLPNRELFRRAVDEALTDRRQDEAGALVLVDLDHFKEVNDALGHHAGDELLRVIARRLTDALRTDDLVARLGGDEFGLILPHASDVAGTVALLTQVRDELGREVTLDGTTLSVEASFGVCFYPYDAGTVEELMQRADAAMYNGKHGPTGVMVYEPAAVRPLADALVLQRELRRGVERDELVLHYQPKVRLGTGEVDSVEALVRWQHPERGLLPPSEFLPVAERSDVIGPLTRWVLRRALRDYADWTAAGHDWTVAVNVSARNLSSLDFVGEVRDMLHEAGVPPSRLALEVTETALAFDSHVARDVVGALSALGIAVSIDDFGIGYTGLSQLRTMHVSEIKVDRTFVSGLVDNPQDRAIVTSIIDLAHGLGCVVTAEGVETRETADWLTAAGCDHGQGYLWMRPSDWRDVATVPPLTALTALPAPTQLPGLPAPAALPGIAAGRAPTTQVVR